MFIGTPLQIRYLNMLKAVKQDRKKNRIETEENWDLERK